MAENMPESDSIDVTRLARMADCLLALGESYATLAKFLREHGVEEIEGTGTPTAERGLKYLASFTSNVLKGYQAARLDGSLKESATDKTLAKTMAAEALARNLSDGKPRRKSGTSGGTRLT